MSVKAARECLLYIYVHASLSVEMLTYKPLQSPPPTQKEVVWGERCRTQFVYWRRGCTSEPAQAGLSLWSFKVYFRRNTNRKTVSHSWPVVVVMRTLICAHDCRRHLIYKPHQTEKCRNRHHSTVGATGTSEMCVCVCACAFVWERNWECVCVVTIARTMRVCGHMQGVNTIWPANTGLWTRTSTGRHRGPKSHSS